MKRTREFYGLTAPIFLEQLFVVFMGIATQIMVSRWVDEYALSAVSMVESVSNLVLAFFGALTIGATIVVAQYTGRGDNQKASGVASQSILLAGGFGFIFCLFFAVFRNPVVTLLFGSADYNVIGYAQLFLGINAFSFPAVAVMMATFGVLRGSGNTHAPMTITIITNVINAGLGFALIWHFGVAGAAIALLVSRYVGAVLGVLYILKRSRTIKFNGLQSFKPDFAVQKTVLGLGLPTSIESGTFQLGKLVITVFIAGMGTAAIAANAIVAAVSGILIAPGMVFSTGTTILVGQRIGRGESHDVRKTAYFTVTSGMLLLLVICIGAFLFMNPIVALYRPTEYVFDIVRPVIITLCIAMPIIWPSSFVSPAALRATGDVKYAMVVAIVSMVFVRVALAYVLGVFFGLGVLGVWISMYADWVARSVFFLWRIRGNKWEGRGVV